MCQRLTTPCEHRAWLSGYGPSVWSIPTCRQSSAFGIASVAAHLPGPFGRPGGYPVAVERGRLSLRLPAEVTDEESRRLNEGAPIYDGVTVDAQGTVWFSDRAVGALSYV